MEWAGDAQLQLRHSATVWVQGLMATIAGMHFLDFFFGIKRGYLCGLTKAALTWHHSWHSLAVLFLATCDTKILSRTVPLMCGEPVSMFGRSTCTGAVNPALKSAAVFWRCRPN